jgi:hypothetical protein
MSPVMGTLRPIVSVFASLVTGVENDNPHSTSKARITINPFFIYFLLFQNCLMEGAPGFPENSESRDAGQPPPFIRAEKHTTAGCGGFPVKPPFTVFRCFAES